MKNSWNCEVRLNFFTKTCLTNNYFSPDPHFVILAGVQSWNIFENFMKRWSLPEFFSQKMSHEQLPYMWSTFRDSSMGAKFKNFWKIHETVKSILLAIATGNIFSIIFLMSRQWWPKFIYCLTITLSVFVPVLNTLGRLYSDLPVLWPNPQWRNVLTQMENICLIGSLRKT